MNYSGNIKKLDDLGRVVIPKEFRERIGLETDAPVEMLIQDNGIFIRKVPFTCALCGSEKSLIDFESSKVCHACVEQIKNK